MGYDIPNNWTLMHKNTPVSDIRINERLGSIVGVDKIHNVKHAPLITTDKLGSINHQQLDKWFKGRAIPASRQNVMRMLHELQIDTPAALSLKSQGLSLSDHYWVKPVEKDILWEEVNFFQNDFSDDIGTLIPAGQNVANINLSSPDNTSDGILQKRWKIIDGKRYLIKAANMEHILRQEPFNEVIASDIMKELNINHIPYQQIFINERAYSMCEAFTTENLELITGHDIIHHVNIDHKKRENHTSVYEHLLQSCEKLGIGNIRSDIERMLVLDYIINNVDRHHGNYGVLRNADTLEYAGFAPVYDSGYSLWCDGSRMNDPAQSRPFKNFHKDQIKLVKDLSWYEPIPKDKLTDIISETLSKNTPLEGIRTGISAERIAHIARITNIRANKMTELKMELAPPMIQVKKPVIKRKVDATPEA